MSREAAGRGPTARDAQHVARPLETLRPGRGKPFLRTRGEANGVAALISAHTAGSGAKALEYLARYMFRTAIANSRLESFENGQVTFRYRDNRTQQLKHIAVPADEFMRRFLWHVLPKGFVKVRSYGLWSPRSPEKLQRAQSLLSTASPPHPQPPAAPSANSNAASTPMPCPYCDSGHLQLIQRLLPQRTRPP